MPDREFQIPSSPLEKGVTFLEAGAGTGKTYTISKMVVRLIAEENLPLSSILVMTFTEAATQELKGRIRSAIQETLHGTYHRYSEDPLAQCYLKSPNKLPDVQHRLKTALATFDEASIFTIHGFCNRVLNEFAFESNHLFEPMLIKEQRPLWKEAILDFWRVHHYQGDAFIPAILDYKRRTPEEILQWTFALNRHPDLVVRPEVSDARYTSSINNLKVLWRKLSDAYSVDRSFLEELLASGEKFKKTFKDLPAIRVALTKPWPEQPTSIWLLAIAKLTRGHLQNQLLKKHENTSLDANFIELCRLWETSVDGFLHQHSFYCLKWSRHLLARKKKAENLLTFDDLLPSILESLESSSGDRLQARIQNTYSAILVDEFQDTDPQQIELFRRLFMSPKHFLFLIGDPKQAIYKFRGADIFSYLHAKSLANSYFTLLKNWRSDPLLIEAINGLFTRCHNPFLFSGIQFLPATAALRNSKLTFENKPLDQPLKLCFQTGAKGKPIGVGQARKTIRSALVQEILHLLEGAFRLDGEDLKPADIAILTRSNFEAHAVREDLSASHLPAIIHSDQTVFETEEASFLQTLLSILLDPIRTEWIRGLYASQWFGWTAEQIVEQNQAADGWGNIQEKMHQLHAQWYSRGITFALDEWIRWSGIKSYLLARTGGERKTTNLLHLIELLSQAELESRFTPLSLFKWLNQNIENPDRERDDFITRLENDDQAIQIVTIHKSKGLQYPIVFIPFAWGSVLDRKNELLIYHSKEHGNRLVYDNQPDPDTEALRLFQKESLSDAMRVLYVALTRARHACYLFWGNYSSQSGSAMGHLFGLSSFSQSSADASPAEALKRLKAEVLNGIGFLDSEEMALQISPPFKRFDEAMELKARPVVRTPDRGFHISSFSSLSSGFKEAIEEHRIEEAETIDVLDEIPAENSIFSVPKGTVTGNLIHDILEYSDYSSADSIRKTTESLVENSHLPNHWSSVIQDHLVNLVSTPLETPDLAIRLRDLHPGNCLKESEFHFPTRNTSIQKLLNFFNPIARLRFGTRLPAPESWNDQKLKGYLRGFIDLTFEWQGRYYILDWKSNWLGNSNADYLAESVQKAMNHHAYFLQYYLYTVATVRYLQIRLPNFDYQSQFGGVFYLFVRGVNKKHPGAGVFFDKPALENVQKLDALFQAS